MSEVIEKEEVKPESVIVDLEPFQTNGQITPKAYWYTVVTKGGEKFQLTVLASGSTVAREGIQHHFPDAAVTFMGFSENIMQIQG